jgi:hypothetical protein
VRILDTVELPVFPRNPSQSQNLGEVMKYRTNVEPTEPIAGAFFFAFAYYESSIDDRSIL